jgi:DNA polymerase III alpha subunit (gram-positive type)
MTFLGASSIMGGQNCRFDVSVMRHSLKRMGELERWRVAGHVDSCFIAKAVFRSQPTCPPNFKLETLGAFFGLPAFAAHDAAEDSFASWRVMRATLERGQVLQEQGAWDRPPALPPLVTSNATLSPEQLQLQQQAL